MTHELGAALIQSDIDPPFVIVGHSFGGLTAPLLATDHSDDLVEHGLDRLVDDSSDPND